MIVSALAAETRSHSKTICEYDRDVKLWGYVTSWKVTNEQWSRRGFDAIAWYVHFHYSADQYGIYVTEQDIQVLGNL